MANYQAMYAVLLQKIAAVIEELQNAQSQAEDLYISSEPPNIRMIDINKQKTDS